MEELVETTYLLLLDLTQRPKLIKRTLFVQPPIRFIRDVFKAVSASTGFGFQIVPTIDGPMNTAEEKYQTIRIIMELVSYTIKDENLPKKVRIRNLLAGQDVQNTLWFLQKLHEAATIGDRNRWDYAASLIQPTKNIDIHSDDIKLVPEAFFTQNDEELAAIGKSNCPSDLRKQEMKKTEFEILLASRFNIKHSQINRCAQLCQEIFSSLEILEKNDPGTLEGLRKPLVQILKNNGTHDDHTKQLRDGKTNERTKWMQNVNGTSPKASDKQEGDVSLPPVARATAPAPAVSNVPLIEAKQPTGTENKVGAERPAPVKKSKSQDIEVKKELSDEELKQKTKEEKKKENEGKLNETIRKSRMEPSRSSMKQISGEEKGRGHSSLKFDVGDEGNTHELEIEKLRNTEEMKLKAKRAQSVTASAFQAKCTRKMSCRPPTAAAVEARKMFLKDELKKFSNRTSVAQRRASKLLETEDSEGKPKPNLPTLPNGEKIYAIPLPKTYKSRATTAAHMVKTTLLLDLAHDEAEEDEDNSDLEDAHDTNGKKGLEGDEAATIAIPEQHFLYSLMVIDKKEKFNTKEVCNTLNMLSEQPEWKTCMPYLNKSMAPLDNIPNPLFYAALQHKNVKVTETLLNLKADVNTPLELDKLWHGVKPGLDVNRALQSRMGHFKGTALFDAYEKVRTVVTKFDPKSEKGEEEQVEEAAPIMTRQTVRKTHMKTIGVSDDKHHDPHADDVKKVACEEHQLFIDPASKYEILELFGEGTIGCVFKVLHKETSQERVMRATPLSAIDIDLSLEQQELLAGLTHRNIIHIFGSYEFDDTLYSIFELLKGGELLSVIIEQGDLQEQTCRFLFKQMLSAVDYIHKQEIAHRSIKPENFILKDNVKDVPLDKAVVKLTDYTTSKQWTEEQPLETKICVLYFVAPEILSNKVHQYTAKVDIWSLGVMFFLMATGRLPFQDLTDFGTLKDIKQKNFVQDYTWSYTDQAKALLDELLETDPEKRLSAEEALKNPWFVLKNHGLKTRPQEEVVPYINHIKSFVLANQLRAQIEQAFQRNITEEELEAIQATFVDDDTLMDKQLIFENLELEFDIDKLHGLWPVVYHLPPDGASFNILLGEVEINGSLAQNTVFHTLLKTLSIPEWYDFVPNEIKDELENFLDVPYDDLLQAYRQKAPEEWSAFTFEDKIMEILADLEMEYEEEDGECDI